MVFNVLCKSSIYLVLVIIAAIAVLLALGVIAFYYWQFPNLSDTHTKWGEFGSFIGGVLSSVFGFFGLIALLVTISMQKKQLDISSQELHLTRKELELSRQAQQETAAALNEQLKYVIISSRLSALQIDLSICQNEINGYYNFMNRIGEKNLKPQQAVGEDGYKDIYRNFSENFQRSKKIQEKILSISKTLIC